MPLVPTEPTPTLCVRRRRSRTGRPVLVELFEDSGFKLVDVETVVGLERRNGIRTGGWLTNARPAVDDLGELGERLMRLSAWLPDPSPLRSPYRGRR